MQLAISEERIVSRIYPVRGKKVMLDRDLAALYDVETGALNRAVKRNSQRFPEDFMFQLTAEEFAALRFQNGISNARSQLGISKGRGGRRYLPYAFTEQGVAMLSSVLNSERAILVNIQIIRTFTKMREMLSHYRDLREKIEALEKKYDSRFKVVFQALEQLLREEEQPKREIGFGKTA